MSTEPSGTSGWTDKELALARRWVETWKLAGADLERIRRRELRELDTYRAIEMLCGPADYTKPPRHIGTHRTTTLVHASRRS